MVMNTIANTGNRVFGTAILLAMLLAAFAAFAEEDTETIGLAVDTSGFDARD